MAQQEEKSSGFEDFLANLGSSAGGNALTNFFSGLGASPTVSQLPTGSVIPKTTGVAAGSTLAPIAAAPLAIATGVNTITGAPKLASGDDLSLAEKGALFLPTFGVSALPKDLRFGGGRNPREQLQDEVRGKLQDLVGDEGRFTGVGGQQLQIQKQGGFDPESNPLHAEAISLANPVGAALVTSGNKAVREDVVHEIANAIRTGATSNEDLRNNLLSFVSRSGLNPDQARQSIAALDLNPRDLEIYTNQLSKLTGEAPEREAELIGRFM